MIKISSRAEYGLRALFDLAQHYGPELVQSGDVAARQQIPEPYLHQLFLLLRRAGLVRSFRGPQGGHRLARRPSRITLAEAIASLEGDIETAKGPSAGSGEPLEVEILHEVWQQVDRSIRDVLQSLTLEDLCQRKRAREQQIMYYI